MALQTKTLTANGSKGHHKFTLTVDENTTSTSGNTSSLSFSFKLSPLQNGWDWYSYGTRISYSININGQVFSGYISQYDGSSTVTIASSSLTVTHNDDGDKTINISFSVNDSSGASYTCGNASSSTNMTLTFIPRKSSVSATNANIGSNTTISINRASSSFTHTLKYSFSDLSGTIVSKTSNTSVSWTIPTSFYAKIPNAKSGTCTITCETYSGNTLIGSSTCTFTASVVNSNPTFSSSQITYLDSNTTITNITGNNQHIVRNLSNLKVIFTSATGKNSATISKYEVTFNGSTKTLTSAGTIDYGTVNLSQNTSVSIKVTDSRGNTTTVSKTITILDWTLPSAVLTYGRVNNYEDETKLKVQVTISSVNEKNSIQSIQYRYKKTTETTYRIYNDLSNNTETTLSLDKLYAWDFQVVIKDKFGTKTYNFVLAKGIPIMFIDIDLKSVGVNCFPTSENSFAVNDSEFLEYEIMASEAIRFKRNNGDVIYPCPYYPVGSIFISVVNENPSKWFGGTWEAFGAGRTLVGVNTSDTDFNTVLKTGGVKTVTLTTSQIPSHTHSLETEFDDSEIVVMRPGPGNDGNNVNVSEGATSSMSYRRVQTLSKNTKSSGSGQAHNNMPPFVAVYFWRRTA